MAAHSALWPSMVTRTLPNGSWRFNFTTRLRRKRISVITKGPTKTRQGRLSVKNRLVTLKMFATGNEERCPVMLFKRYLETRPSEIKKSGPFRLSVFDEPISSVWDKKTPVGKNIINTFMKNMKDNSALKDLCPEMNLTYHSARKTVVKKLKS